MVIKKMNMIKQIFGIVILMTLTSCSQADKLNESEKELIINDVIEMFGNYHNDIRKDGLTAEFKYLDQSTDFFWVPPGYKSALSYDSVRQILEINAKSFQAIEFNWDTLQVFPLSDKIANYSGIVKGSMIDTSGIKSSVIIIESGTVIKRSDGWKLLSGQSAILNPESEK
ncbi:hypothetical protein IH824_07605 [candidate division KSB1 bacterium]|nr:hypothetical protein [candidate division KSB1 bacterium]